MKLHVLIHIYLRHFKCKERHGKFCVIRQSTLFTPST